MEVQILSNENIVSLRDKKVYCWGMIKDNLTELFQNYDLIDKVVAIIDNNPKKQGFVEFCDIRVPVVSSEVLKKVVLSELSIIITNDYYEEILTEIEKNYNYLLEECNIFRFVNRQDSIDLYYRKLYETTELENIIVFRSGPIRSSYIKGTDFLDNARALFEYMLDNNYNEKYKLVWLVKNPEEFSKYNGIENVEFLSFDWEDSEKKEERDTYYHRLCLAKYIFMTDAYGFVKNARRDQIRIQLWHGCGFKTRTTFTRCEKRYEYTTVISDLYAGIHEDIYGLRKDQVLVTGYAKQDWLFQPYEKELSELLGVKKSSKYIFWLPTFRMADDNISNLSQYEINPETGLPIVMYKEQLLELDKLLEQLDITMIIKLHPFQKDILIKDYQCNNIAVLPHSALLENDLIINRLLASADAMISDYSSAAVDFLVLDRPLAFTLDDVEEYENSRGFVFENIREWLPGKEVFDYNDFCQFIQEIADGQDTTKEKRGKVSEKMLKYRDNQNCRRIVEAFHI